METLTDANQLSALASELIQQGTAFGISLISAIIILIAGYIVAGWASRALESRLREAKKFDATLIPVLGQALRYTILAFTAVLVLAQFGVQTASLIAVIGAAGLAIGLALQGTLQNVAAGLMLLILRPFQVGDWIDAAGKSGACEEIGLFMTKLKDFEGMFIAVPNSKIWADTIVNYSRNPHRRLVLDAGISYDDDIDRASEVLREMVNADERILQEPDPPQVLVSSYGDSSVNLQIRAWTRNDEFWPVHFDMTRAIKYALDEARITIPYPHRHVIISADGEDRIQLAESASAAPKRTTRKAPAKSTESAPPTKTASADSASAAKGSASRRKPTGKSG
ncbi:mechanosensitive ion channel family protein [Dichotomicrobium thermohalophilum]|uniref:Small-conductance mechanosensitive channel n=1 Tax=Dichotomicrobium thermohalophilum TaxID=933063 RepID=A0A397Q6M6_9HYPH|nr:mechanosensitive ion channel domain-containing protein [Dichotomicrobium thermohalophilum]RIA56603.1 small conductance mechanosensitive channel [Dichotomicrobium thermohalophilum]